MKPLFRVKVCGLVDPEVVPQALEAGVDAFGLNFAPISKRRVDQATARQITVAIDGRAKVVGVFVDASLCEILDRFEAVPLDFVQLHGKETFADYAALAREIGAQRIIRALPWDSADTSELQRFLNVASDQQLLPAAVLIDSVSQGQFGGTGTTVAWEQVGQRDRSKWPVPLILAGGLTPENVADAIRIAEPDAVDVAGGVERSAGFKDPIKTQRFATAALAAFRDQAY